MRIEGVIPVNWAIVDTGNLGVVCERPDRKVTYVGQTVDNERTRVTWHSQEYLPHARVWNSVRDMTGATHAWSGVQQDTKRLILERQLVPAPVAVAGSPAIAGYLYGIDGCDVDEIAGLLGIGSDTVQMYLRRHKNGWYRERDSYA